MNSSQTRSIIQRSPTTAGDRAIRQVNGPDASYAVDAAFARYAREAVNFGGGRYCAS